MTQQTLMGHGLFIVEALRSDSNTPHSVGLLWRSDQHDAETTNNTHKRHIYTPPAGFEPAVPASQRPQIHVLDGAATGIGETYLYRLSYRFHLNTT
jgi:hypothetical protein